MKIQQNDRSAANIVHVAVARTRVLSGMIVRALLCSVFLALTGAGLVLTAGRVAAQPEGKAAKPDQAPTGNAENGKKLFLKDGCYECHGREAQGGGYNGPRLAPNPVPLEYILKYVRHPAGEMPPYTDRVLSDKDLADIHAFLESVKPPPPVDTIPILK